MSDSHGSTCRCRGESFSLLELSTCCAAGGQDVCVVALMVVLERALRLAGVIELVLVEEWLTLVRNDRARRAHCACAYFWTC